PLPGQRLQRFTGRISVGGPDPDIVDPALLAPPPILHHVASEELVVAPRHLLHGLHMMPEDCLVEPDSQKAELAAGAPDPVVHRVAAETLRWKPREELMCAGTNARRGKDRIGRSYCARKGPNQLREHREVLPGPADRGGGGHVEFFLPAERERKGGDQDGTALSNGVPERGVQPARPFFGLQAVV